MKWTVLALPLIVLSCVLVKKKSNIQEITFKGQVICRADQYFQSPVMSNIKIISERDTLFEFDTDENGNFSQQIKINTNSNPYSIFISGLENINIDTVVVRYLSEDEKIKGRKRVEKYNNLYDKGLIDFKLKENFDTIVPVGPTGYILSCVDKNPTLHNVFIKNDSTYKLRISCGVLILEDEEIE